MSDRKLRTILCDPDVVFPDHVGHKLTYIERGWHDYRINKFVFDEYEIQGEIYAELTPVFEDRPINGEITDITVWCETCNHELIMPDANDICPLTTEESHEPHRSDL